MRSADLGGVLFLLAIFWAITQAARKGAARRLPPQPPAPPAPRPGGDTQAEGRRLEEWLEGLEGLGGRGAPGAARAPAPRRAPVPARRPQASGPLGRPADRPLEDAEDVEDRTSLEAERPAPSRPLPARAPREEVDLRVESEAAVRRRLAAAEANLRPLGAADHAAFDARIRPAPADRTAAPATPRSRAARLREAIVWREILGPPRALEDG